MSAGESSIPFAGGEGTRTLQDRSLRLFIVLSAFFCVNAALAEFIGVKIFALEDTLGIAPLQWNLFGQTGSLNFTAGTLLWPVVFLMTDVINEFFGRRGVRLISWLAAILIAYGFVFAAIFGQGMWSIGGSLVAFMLGQLIDVAVFHRIRSATGDKHIWLRATGSTAVSQLVDSFVVLYIAFVLGPQHWPIPQFLAISTVNYGYKMLAAFAMIPLIYLLRVWIHSYLGHARAKQLRDEAAAD